MRRALPFLTFAALSFGQTFEVKDRNGIPLVIISEVKMFRHSSKLDRDIPFLQGTLTNISGAALKAALMGTLRKKDGEVGTFPVGIAIDNTFLPCTVTDPCDFEKDSPREIVYPFPQPWFSEGDVQSVEFSFPDRWQSPEDKRLASQAQTKRDAEAAQAQAKKDAADAARRKRLAAEQKKKQADLNAREAKERAEEEAKAAEERGRVRAACSAAYQKTADKKLKDLTVKEEQQVRACQALGLYTP